MIDSVFTAPSWTVFQEHYDLPPDLQEVWWKDEHKFNPDTLPDGVWEVLDRKNALAMQALECGVDTTEELKAWNGSLDFLGLLKLVWVKGTLIWRDGRERRVSDLKEKWVIYFGTLNSFWAIEIVSIDDPTNSSKDGIVTIRSLQGGFIFPVLVLFDREIDQEDIGRF